MKRAEYQTQYGEPDALGVQLEAFERALRGEDSTVEGWQLRDEQAVRRDGVGVLIVELAGQVQRSANEVCSVVDELDALGSPLGDKVDVAVLDVTGFANASGDEAGILPHVFRGLPCCWVVPDLHTHDLG